MLLDDQNAGWSRNGAEALVEWLEELEDDIGEEIEFDIVGIRCDFTEYPSAVATCQDYMSGFEAEGEDEEEREENALDLLREKTTVIEFDGGVIIQAY